MTTGLSVSKKKVKKHHRKWNTSIESVVIRQEFVPISQQSLDSKMKLYFGLVSII
jgi:hypothetical protein